MDKRMERVSISLYDMYILDKFDEKPTNPRHPINEYPIWLTRADPLLEWQASFRKKKKKKVFSQKEQRRRDSFAKIQGKIAARFGFEAVEIRRAPLGERGKRTNEAWQSRLRRGRGGGDVNPADSMAAHFPSLDRSGRSHVSGPSWCTVILGSHLSS